VIGQLIGVVVKTDSELLSLANQLHSQGKVTQANQHYEYLLQKYPQNPNLLHLSGQAVAACGEYDKACLLIKKAIKEGGMKAVYFSNLAICYNKMQKFTDAKENFYKAISLDKNYLNSYKGLGELYMQQQDYLAAVKILEQAYTINNNDMDIINNLAYGYKSTLQAKKACLMYIKLYKHNIKAQNNDNSDRFNLSCYQLQLTDFQEGWRNYTTRTKISYPQLKCLDKVKVWRGDKLAQKNLLLLGEQGPADRITFLSMVDDLLDLGARIIICDVDLRLTKIILATWPQIKIITPIDYKTLQAQDFDYFCYMGDLGTYLRTKLDDFPSRSKYLKPKPEIVTHFRDKYTKLATGRPLVGISWRGGKNKVIQDRFNIPYQQLDKLLDNDCYFVNLQYNVSKKEQQYLQKRIYFDADVNSVDNFHDFAAQIASLDLIISIDNTTVPFAGSLGIKTWVMTRVLADWRWHPDSNKSSWFPTVEVFVQNEHDNWEALLTTLTNKLNGYCSNLS